MKNPTLQYSTTPSLQLLSMNLSFQLNGKPWRSTASRQETLAEVLRNTLNLNGTKVSCEVQVCGACTVLIDGAPVSACTYFAYEARGKSLTTIEGLEKPDGTLHPIATSVHRRVRLSVRLLHARHDHVGQSVVG